MAVHFGPDALALWISTRTGLAGVLQRSHAHRCCRLFAAILVRRYSTVSGFLVETGSEDVAVDGA